MTRDQLLFVAIFVLVPLLNFLVGLLRKRRQRTVEPEAAAHPAPVPSLPTTVTNVLPLAIPRAPSAAPPPGPVSPPIARRRSPHLRPADVRRGIVLMTILGRCPGLEGPLGERPSW